MKTQINTKLIKPTQRRKEITKKNFTKCFGSSEKCSENKKFRFIFTNPTNENRFSISLIFVFPAQRENQF